MFGNEKISPELLLSMASGVAQGPNLTAGLGNMFGNASSVIAAQREKQQTEQQKSATYEALRAIDPQKAELFRTGVLSASQAFATFQEERAKKEAASKPSWKWMNIDGKLVRIDENAGTVEEQADYSKPKLPPIAEEYNWAKDNGFNGTPQEYQAWKANLSKQKGMTVEYDPINGFRMTQGDVDKAPPKLTEAQSKDINFLTRAKKAEEQLAPLEKQLTSWTQKRVDQLPMDAGEYLKTPEYQQAEQAGREILAIILRKDTGAAVTPQEFEVYSKIYLPQPGNDAATIAAKKRSREAAIRGIQSGLGPLAPEDDAALPGATTDPIPAEDYFKQ